MIPILLAPLTQNKVTKFEQFTEVNQQTLEPTGSNLAPPHLGQGAATSASVGRVKCFVFPQAVHFQPRDRFPLDCSIFLRTESA